ncbi:MAG TPA: hypothetical protein VI855_01620 [Dehalococcoidia bacterium]|nr:hypothetical protein [Dehalococcoidia bacterium]
MQPSRPRPKLPIPPPSRRPPPVCDICGSPMIERQCKVRCPNCGYTRDCSDP